MVLLAEQHLVGEAVRIALSSRGLDPVTVPWITGRPTDLEMRRRILSLRPRVGLIFGNLDDPARRTEARAVVAGVPLRWLLVVRDPTDAGWGSLLEAGASGVIPQAANLEALVQTLVTTIVGRPVMTPEARQALMVSWRRLERSDQVTLEHLASLTPREQAVLTMLYDGQSVATIAETGGVSEGTVRSQVKAVLRKLGVSSQLAAVAAYRGVLEQRRGGSRDGDEGVE